MSLLKRFKRLFVEEKQEKRPKDDVLHTDIVKIKAPDISDAIKTWEKQVELLQNHPLSQARVVNTDILASLSDVLGGLEGRLGELSKLDEILGILKAQETRKIEQNTLKPVEKVLKNVRHVTIKDRILLDLIEGKPLLDADTVADELNLTRSTVSYRLNKLYSMGVLDKEVSGRKILFKLTQHNQD